MNEETQNLCGMKNSFVLFPLIQSTEEAAARALVDPRTKTEEEPSFHFQMLLLYLLLLHAIPILIIHIIIAMGHGKYPICRV